MPSDVTQAMLDLHHFKGRLLTLRDVSRWVGGRRTLKCEYV